MARDARGPGRLPGQPLSHEGLTLADRRGRIFRVVNGVRVWSDVSLLSKQEEIDAIQSTVPTVP